MVDALKNKNAYFTMFFGAFSPQKDYGTGFQVPPAPPIKTPKLKGLRGFFVFFGMTFGMTFNFPMLSGAQK